MSEFSQAMSVVIENFSVLEIQSITIFHILKCLRMCTCIWTFFLVHWEQTESYWSTQITSLTFTDTHLSNHASWNSPSEWLCHGAQIFVALCLNTYTSFEHVHSKSLIQVKHQKFQKNLFTLLIIIFQAKMWKLSIPMVGLNK